MKTRIILTSIILAVASASASAWTSWANSPNNWANSSNNWANSSNNWANSPNNWANSSTNSFRTNGIYDTQGNSVGYRTTSPSGTINLFTNDGRRYGYGR